MSYQVLARKWRPPDFDSLVGQDHVVTALRNALSDGRIAQAYLFSGIRGVGKTTAARVLAKALNCLSGPDGGLAADPCNDCDSCREINDGGTLDVLEVDAATYSKVEQVRELTETLRYAPVRGRYKVVVLDEVHRLSRQAFDALLKIVEEPPPHLVFIFATTEIDAVPATILSRCQEFQFRRVASPVVAAHLRRICDAEDIIASDAALRLIARAGEGSVRDAVALLDQMSTFGHGTISDDEAGQLLAGFDAALFGRLLKAVLEGDALEVSAVSREVESNGWDPHHVFGQFLSFCRDGLHLAMGGDPSTIDLPAEEAKTLAELVSSRPGGYRGLLQILHLLLASEATVKRSEFAGVALEIAWLRAAELPRVEQIEALLAAGSDSGGTVTPPRGPSGNSPTGALGGGGSSTPRRGNPAAAHSRSEEAVADETDAVSEASASSADESRTAEPVGSAPSRSTSTAALDPSRIGSVLELLPPSFAGPLRATRLGLRSGSFVIVLDQEERHVRSALSRRRNADALEEALRKIFGPGIPWRIESSADDLAEYVVDRTSAPPVKEVDPPRPDSRNGSRSARYANPPSAETVPRSDPPPVDLYDRRAPEAQTAELDFAPPDRPAPTQPDNGTSPRRAEPTPETLQIVENLPTVQLVQSLFRGKIRRISDEVEEAAPP
ncbi:MAG: DNA polymerase III subunit gamma/tau [Thermoanaerobaculia bacterium]|nr:DNA polymerase III subunit gamma/tau [Thermoanaerobaculia bacterium]